MLWCVLLDWFGWNFFLSGSWEGLGWRFLFGAAGNGYLRCLHSRHSRALLLCFNHQRRRHTRRDDLRLLGLLGPRSLPLLLLSPETGELLRHVAQLCYRTVAIILELSRLLLQFFVCLERLHDFFLHVLHFGLHCYYAVVTIVIFLHQFIIFSPTSIQLPIQLLYLAIGFLDHHFRFFRSGLGTDHFVI